MYPNLSDLFAGLFGIHISLPLQTFGFFVALSFLLTYYAFKSEFKRKEALGVVQAFKRKVVIGKPPSILEMAVNAGLGFLFGFKVFAILFNYKSFTNDPKEFIFSTRGNIIAGLLFGAGWAYLAYRDIKKEQLPEPVLVEQEVHPYQLMGKMTFWAAFWGFTGAKLFDAAEHISYFWHAPLAYLIAPTGFTYYGAFIFGAIACLCVSYRKEIKILPMTDIGSPGMMLAYAVGRIGCQLSGDGDWGIVNTHPKPGWLSWLPDWMWADKFPHNIINEGVYIPGCQGVHCNQLTQGVYPTAFYEMVICMLLFAFMWAIRKRIHRAGMLFFIYLILMGTERFFIEIIRITPRYNVLGVLLTQAQTISIVIFLGGVAGIIFLNTASKKAAVANLEVSPQ